MTIKLNTWFLVLGETETTAYAGDKGKTAYDHSQAAHAPSNAEQNVNADWNASSRHAQILNKPTIPSPGRIPYGATIYKSGSTYYAIDPVNTAVSSGSVFSTVLQAAIDSLTNGGSVFVASGAYTLDASITINRNCKLCFDKYAQITISGNIDAFTILRGASIEGGRITVPSGYTGNCIVVDVDDQIWSDTVDGIRNIELYNPGTTGTAIYIRTLTTEIIGNESGGFLYGFIIENVRIWKFDYGIRFYQVVFDGMNWINGNKFKDIWIIWPNWGIHASADDETGASGFSDFQMNTFENVNIQSRNGVGAHTHPVWRILGSNNVFKHCSIWDWSGSGYQYAIQAAALSSSNYFEWISSHNILQSVTDSGYNNVFCNITDIRDKPGITNPNNQIRVNIGNPTLEEIVLCQGQYKNQLRFTAPNTQEQSTDGTTWTDSTRMTTGQLKVLMIGEGEGLSDDAAAIIPSPTVGGAGYYRLTWNATSIYTVLNALYMSLNTGGNSVTVKIDAYKTLTSTWVTVATGTVTSDPANHVWFPHSSITFKTGNDSSYRGNVRITFSITNAAYAAPTYITMVEWFGSLPAGKRHAESYDEYKNVTFPSGIYGDHVIVDKVSGLIYPTQASTEDAAAGYEKGAIYFDTTLNKLRVGGATGWETINSS